MLGKWDVGHFVHAMLPRERGFDTFYGYYSSYVSYFDHISEIFDCATPEEAGSGKGDIVQVGRVLFFPR